MVKKSNRKLIQFSLIIGIVLLVITGCGGNKYKAVDANEAYSLIEQGNYIIIDVRSPDEYAEGHIPNSINIPVDEIEGSLLELDSEMNYLLICRIGARSERAAHIMLDSGFANVINLENGLVDWPYDLEAKEQTIN